MELRSNKAERVGNSVGLVLREVDSFDSAENLELQRKLDFEEAVQDKMMAQKWKLAVSEPVNLAKSLVDLIDSS